MKNAIVFLLFLVNVGVIRAQYDIVQTGVGKYQIVNLNPPWTTGDLITWIFPDGQYMKKSIHLNNGVVLNQTDRVDWTPYIDPSPNSTDPDKIQAFVAEKGGTGTPPPVSFNFSGQFGSTLPASIFPTIKDWQLNRSWEFSPASETYLLFSYQPKNLCGSIPIGDAEIRVYYPSQLTYTGNTNAYPQGFYNEIVQDFPTQNYLKIKNFLYTQDLQKHIFLKFSTNPQTPIGTTVQITAAGKFCNTYDSVIYRIVTAAVPHDPNKKTVDIEKICLNQFYPIKLTYTIQFQNDGNAPVDSVIVKDELPLLLDPQSFHLKTPVPIMNGVHDGSDISMSSSGSLKELKFTGTGLPGLNQTTPYSYSYDQTIYRFSFDVNLTDDPVDTVKNKAGVIFFNNAGLALPTISTTVTKTFTGDSSPGLDCYYSSTSESLDIVGSILLKPNPFLDQLDIAFELKEKSRLSIEVRDIWGRLIEPIATGEYTAGPQQFTWNGIAAPDGIYLIYLRTEKGSIAKKVVKVR